MEKLKNMFSSERMSVNDFIIDIIQTLGDEQDFTIEIVEKNSPLVFQLRHAPHSITGTEVPTLEELETFMNVAVVRMKDLYEQYNWNEGVTISYTPDGEVTITINEDALGLEP